MMRSFLGEGASAARGGARTHCLRELVPHDSQWQILGTVFGDVGQLEHRLGRSEHRLLIAIAHGDACIKVDFPDRPAIH